MASAKVARQQKLTVTRQCAGCDARLFPSQLNKQGLCKTCADAKLKSAVMGALEDAPVAPCELNPVSESADAVPGQDVAPEVATKAQSLAPKAKPAPKSAPAPKAQKPALSVVKSTPQNAPKTAPAPKAEPKAAEATLLVDMVDRTGVRRVMLGGKYLSYKQYNAGGKAGCVRSTKGGKYSLYKADQAGLDTKGGEWATVCEEHHTIANYPSLGKAEARLSGGWWCEACQKQGRE